MSRAKFATRLLIALAPLLALAGFALTGVGTSAAASSSSAAPAVYGKPRLWHGMWIQALDPTPAQVARHEPGAATASATSTSTSTSASTSTTTTTTTTSTSTSSTVSKSAVPKDKVLSNNSTFSSWAYVNQLVPIYSSPSASSKKVTKLHWLTEDGFPEVYMLLGTHWTSPTQEWVHIRVPRRPNGTEGWVRSYGLGKFHMTRNLIVVSISKERMYLHRDGKQIWSAAVGVGAPNTPTPTGDFWIRERFKISDPSNGYYPYAFGTADYSTLTDWPGGGVVGIHGPYGDPGGIPGRISHGCIRLEVSSDFWLAGHVGVGTPVDVVS